MINGPDSKVKEICVNRSYTKLTSAAGYENLNEIKNKLAQTFILCLFHSIKQTLLPWWNGVKQLLLDHFAN